MTNLQCIVRVKATGYKLAKLQELHLHRKLKTALKAIYKLKIKKVMPLCIILPSIGIEINVIHIRKFKVKQKEPPKKGAHKGKSLSSICGLHTHGVRMIESENEKDDSSKDKRTPIATSHGNVLLKYF